jgi:CotS family spore coat protein
LAIQSQEPLMDVLNSFELKVLSIKNETYKEKKGVWWVETDKGLRVLKKISNSEQTLRYILSAIEHLARNGINLASVIKTKNGKNYVNIDDTCYVLCEAIQGKSPSYDSEKELALIIKELARFHIASRGFKPLADTKPKIHLGSWVADYTEQIEDMNTFYSHEVSTKDGNSIGKMIIDEFPYFQDRAKKAIDCLKGKEYNTWVEKANKQGSLCHQDFAAGNLILNSSGKLYVLDTDSITIDIPARDLRKILSKVMKKIGKWDIELTRKIFKIYHSENPLEPTEWKVVMYDLMFPHLFLGAMNKYYYQRDKEWTTEKYFKRIKEMSAFEKTIAPVINNFDSLIPIF